jgi:hypothetical protein
MAVKAHTLNEAKSMGRKNSPSISAGLPLYSFPVRFLWNEYACPFWWSVLAKFGQPLPICSLSLERAP